MPVGVCLLQALGHSESQLVGPLSRKALSRVFRLNVLSTSSTSKVSRLANLPDIVSLHSKLQLGLPSFVQINRKEKRVLEQD